MHLGKEKFARFKSNDLFLFRIIKRLGCPNCQPRGRSFTADQLRGKVRLALNKLRLLNQHRFKK